MNIPNRVAPIIAISLITQSCGIREITKPDPSIDPAIDAIRTDTEKNVLRAKKWQLPTKEEVEKFPDEKLNYYRFKAGMNFKGINGKIRQLQEKKRKGIATENDSEILREFEESLKFYKDMIEILDTEIERRNKTIMPEPNLNIRPPTGSKPPGTSPQLRGPKNPEKNNKPIKPKRDIKRGRVYV